ncbi:MAG: polyprenyl synthetase family protein [Spirochaetales bacterium]|nr:polyprenyl synthetase family protein [Spirochaetales bacterium]
MSGNIEQILEKIEREVVAFFQEDSSIIKKSTGRNLDSLSYENIQRILAPGKDLILRGGKRWRPLMMYLISNSFVSDEKILKLCPVVEIAHNGTLIVDDIEDLSEVRRGKPCVHRIYGDDLSINAGNQMYFLALLNIDLLSLSLEKKAAFHEIYSRYMRRLHFGQGLDILWHRNVKEIPSIDEYLQMCRLKTGALSGMAAEFGLAYAVAGGVSLSESVVSGLVDAAEMMGIGFQIADDVKNLVGKIEGKDRGDDIVEGKKSLPVIIFAQESGAQIDRLFSCFESAKRLGIVDGWDSVSEAIELLESSGAIRKASEIGLDLLTKSIANFNKFLPESEEKSNLLSLIESFLKKSDIIIDVEKR